MCWRVTFSLPAEALRRFSAWVSADFASPCSLLSSMMIFSRLPIFSSRSTTSGTFRS